jgi:hypothetical protein
MGDGANYKTSIIHNGRKLICHSHLGRRFLKRRPFFSNLVPRVCLFAGYVVAWLWGNRIEIVIWLAAVIINAADTINACFFARITRGHTRRENYQCLSDLECEIKQYKSKDIILIVWKSIGTLGIYLQNGMVFMNDFLSIYSMNIFIIVCGNDGVTIFVFIPW